MRKYLSVILAMVIISISLTGCLKGCDNTINTISESALLESSDNESFSSFDTQSASSDNDNTSSIFSNNTSSFSDNRSSSSITPDASLYENLPDRGFPIPMRDGVVIPYDAIYLPDGDNISTTYVYEDESVTELYKEQLRNAGFTDYGTVMSVDSLWSYERDNDGASLYVEIRVGTITMYVNGTTTPPIISTELPINDDGTGKIHFGMSMEEFDELIEKESWGEPFMSSYGQGAHTEYKFEEKGFMVHFNPNNKIGFVSIVNNNASTQKGLTIGDSEQKMIDLYGKISSIDDQFNSYEYSIGKAKLNIRIDNGTITSINISDPKQDF